jgi:hypothetical protein
MLMRSVSDLEDQPAPLAGAAGADDRAERPSDAALAADHLAHVVLRDVQAEDDGIFALLLLHADGVGIVYELPSQVREQVSQDS